MSPTWPTESPSSCRRNPTTKQRERAAHLGARQRRRLPGTLATMAGAAMAVGEAAKAAIWRAAGDPREGLIGVGEVLATLGIETDVESVAWRVLAGRYHQALGEHPVARDAFEDARRAALAQGEPLLAAIALGALAGQDRVDGRYDTAIRRGTTALTEAVRVVGDDDRLVASLRNELAITYKSVGRFDQAEPLYRAALACLETALGPDHPELAATLHNLAGLTHARGDQRAAERMARRGLAIRVAALGDDHLAVALDRAALAPIIDALGRPDEADQLLQDALGCFERVLGDDHYEVAVTLHNLGAIDHRQGRLDQAAARYRRSLRIRAGVLSESHPELGTTLVNLAVLERARGNPAAARRALTRAIELLEPAVPADHPTLVAARQEWDTLELWGSLARRSRSGSLGNAAAG